MEELRRRLLARAFLYDDPAAFAAGVEAVLGEIGAHPTTLDEVPTAS
jgi:hypothetical protein